MQSIQQLLRRAAPGLMATLAAAVLMACGGGGGTSAGSGSAPQSAPSAPTSATLSVVEGTITGFGSVVIHGHPRLPATVVDCGKLCVPSAKTWLNPPRGGQLQDTNVPISLQVAGKPRRGDRFSKQSARQS